MALYVAIGTLAAFGAMCMLWAVIGWLLPDSGGVLRYCPGTAEEAMRFAGRYLWLRGAGLIRCRLVIAQAELDETERRWLTDRGILVNPEPEHGIGAESN